jgi:transcriptional regulator with XRE-family HTH domain
MLDGPEDLKVRSVERGLMTLSPAQCRAARALLAWSQEELVRHAKITKKTIADFERGATTPRSQTLDQILAAFEAAGIEFLNGNQPGVRLKSRASRG